MNPTEIQAAKDLHTIAAPVRFVSEAVMHMLLFAGFVLLFPALAALTVWLGTGDFGFEKVIFGVFGPFAACIWYMFVIHFMEDTAYISEEDEWCGHGGIPLGFGLLLSSFVGEFFAITINSGHAIHKVNYIPSINLTRYEVIGFSYGDRWSFVILLVGVLFFPTLITVFRGIFLFSNEDEKLVELQQKREGRAEAEYKADLDAAYIAETGETREQWQAREHKEIEQEFADRKKAADEAAAQTAAQSKEAATAAGIDLTSWEYIQINRKLLEGIETLAREYNDSILDNKVFIDLKARATKTKTVSPQEFIQVNSQLYEVIEALAKKYDNRVVLDLIKKSKAEGKIPSADGSMAFIKCSDGTKCFNITYLPDGSNVGRLESPDGTKYFDITYSPDGTKKWERTESPDGTKYFDVLRLPDGTSKVGHIEYLDGRKEFDVTTLPDGSKTVERVEAPLGKITTEVTTGPMPEQMGKGSQFADGTKYCGTAAVPAELQQANQFSSPVLLPPAPERRRWWTRPLPLIASCSLLAGLTFLLFLFLKPSATDVEHEHVTHGQAEPPATKPSPVQVRDPKGSRLADAEGLRLLSKGRNDLNGAKLQFQKAVDLDGNNIEALNNLGDVYGKLEDYRTAEAILAKVLTMAPKRRVAHGNIGYVQAKQGNIEGAARHFCEYVHGFDNFDRGETKLKTSFGDLDPQVQNALSLTIANCRP